MPGDDRGRRDLLAGVQRDAGRDAIGRRDRHDPCPGADLRPGRLRGGRQRVGDGRRPALREHRLARGAAVVAGGVGEQHGGRPGRPRPHRRVPDAAPGERRPHGLGAERLADVVRDRHREDAQDRVAVGLAQAAERAPEPEADQRVAEARRVDLGRRLVPEVREEPGQRSDAAGRTRRRPSRRPPTRRGSPSTDLPRSAHSVTARPSGCGANTRTSGETSDSPCFVSASSRATDGRRRPTVCASAGTRTPGASSSVTVAPPIRSRASSTRTRRPPVARYAAAVRPLWPAPTTIAS